MHVFVLPTSRATRGCPKFKGQKCRHIRKYLVASTKSSCAILWGAVEIATFVLLYSWNGTFYLQCYQFALFIFNKTRAVTDSRSERHKLYQKFSVSTSFSYSSASVKLRFQSQFRILLSMQRRLPNKFLYLKYLFWYLNRSQLKNAHFPNSSSCQPSFLRKY